MPWLFQLSPIFHYLVNPPSPPYSQSPIFLFKHRYQHHFLGGPCPPLHHYLLSPLGLQPSLGSHCCALPTCFGHIPLGHCSFSHPHCRHHLMTVGLNCLRGEGKRSTGISFRSWPQSQLSAWSKENFERGVFAQAWEWQVTFLQRFLVVRFT